jgi:hypothetical protein
VPSWCSCARIHRALQLEDIRQLDQVNPTVLRTCLALTFASGKRPETAIQHIVLSGGKDHADIFRQYKAAVTEVSKYIYRTLDVSEPVVREDPDALFVGRCVFTKVSTMPLRYAKSDGASGHCQQPQATECVAAWRRSARNV